jgi:hypothetical protein
MKVHEQVLELKKRPYDEQKIMDLCDMANNLFSFVEKNY